VLAVGGVGEVSLFQSAHNPERAAALMEDGKKRERVTNQRTTKTRRLLGVVWVCCALCFLTGHSGQRLLN
jgi:hypothetical protein